MTSSPLSLSLSSRRSEITPKDFIHESQFPNPLGSDPLDLLDPVSWWSSSKSSLIRCERIFTLFSALFLHEDKVLHLMNESINEIIKWGSENPEKKTCLTTPGWFYGSSAEPLGTWQWNETSSHPFLSPLPNFEEIEDGLLIWMKAGSRKTPVSLPDSKRMNGGPHNTIYTRAQNY